MQVAIVGAGYVGLVTGVSLSAYGHRVSFVEIDPTRVAALRAGRMPIEEPGLSEAYTAHRERISVTTDIAEAVQGASIVHVAVGTPIGEAGDPDLSQLTAVLGSLEGRPDLHVSVRSTLPPGTSMRLPAMMGRPDGTRISTNPEFLRQGTAMADFLHPTRIVIGRFPETSAEHLALLDQLLAPIDGPRLTVDVAAAELIKNVANGFLALKLSFVNEVAALSEEYGVDVGQVLDGIAFDPRIGSTYMRPGLGFGGSCLPKELQVLAAAGRRQGIPMHIARAAALVNVEQQDRFVRRILAELPADGARVGLLGLSFKADTDDLRGSPSVYVARRLLDAGHDVIAHDPAVRAEQALAVLPGLRLASAPLEAWDDAEALVIGTEWPAYAAIDLEAVRDRMRTPLLFDGRNLIDPADAARAGIAYRGIGRGQVDAAKVLVEASSPRVG